MRKSNANKINSTSRYKVLIDGRYSKHIEVTAKNEMEAMKKAEQRLYNNEFMFTSLDFIEGISHETIILK